LQFDRASCVLRNFRRVAERQCRRSRRPLNGCIRIVTRTRSLGEAPVASVYIWKLARIRG
jgi:hypothetical protein